MVRQLQPAMAALLAALCGQAPAADALAAPAPAGACVAACASARAGCRDSAYRQGYQEVATLRRRAGPPLSTPEIAAFMRRERVRLAVCEAQRAACAQECAPALRPMDESVHRSRH